MTNTQEDLGDAPDVDIDERLKRTSDALSNAFGMPVEVMALRKMNGPRIRLTIADRKTGRTRTLKDDFSKSQIVAVLGALPELLSFADEE